MRWTLFTLLMLSAPAFADGGIADAGASDGGGDAGANDDAGLDDAGLDDAGTDGGVDVDAGLDDAGTDGGVDVDAGCKLRCDGDVLVFCDSRSGARISIDCRATLDAGCQVLSEDWGPDCALDEGAACDPGYADGESRCRQTLFCTDGVCSTDAPAAPDRDAGPDVGTNAGGINAVAEENNHPLACLGCSDANTPDLPFGLGLALWSRGALRRLSRARMRRRNADDSRDDADFGNTQG